MVVQALQSVWFLFWLCSHLFSAPVGVLYRSDWRHEISLRAVDNLPFINTVDDKLKCFADRSSTNTAPTVDPACRETNPFILFVTWMDWIYISSFLRLGSMLLFDSLAWAGGRETLCNISPFGAPDSALRNYVTTVLCVASRAKSVNSGAGS